MIKYKDLLILKLSETTQWKSETEMLIPNSMMKGWLGSIFTCEFADLTDRIYILRSYYKNGVRYWQEDYKNGKRHGQYIGWYENGKKCWKYEYKGGKLIRNIND